MSVASLYLLDVNVLIALTNPTHVHHSRAQKWFGGVENWATCPMTEAAFTRLMLNPNVAGRTISRIEVLAVLSALRAWKGHVFMTDNTSLADATVDLAGLIGHGQVTDFHLVNLAAGRNAVLATFDAAIPAALVGSDKGLVELV